METRDRRALDLRRWHGRLAAGLFILVAVAGTRTLATEAPRYRGRSLIAVLDELRAQGLELIYSSAVVRPDLVVSVEPSAQDPRSLLDQILTPLGLEAKAGPRGSLRILPRRVKAAPGPVPAAAAFSTSVVVTPGRHAVLWEDPVAGRQIEHTDTVPVPNIGGDVSRVLEQLPGVAAPDSSAAFNVRGSLAEDASLVLDGLELYDPFHLQSLQSPFSLIDNQLVDRIEFLGGGFTADYGDRHGAFVEITTLSPATERRGEVEVGTLNSRASYGAPFGEGTGSWLASVRGWYPEALVDSLEPGEGRRLRPNFGDAYTKVAWTVSPRTSFSAHGLFARDRLDYLETGEIDNESVVARTDSGYLWVRLANVLTARMLAETVLSGGRINRSRSGVSATDAGAFTVDDDRAVEFVGLTHDLRWQISDTQLLKGGLYARQLRAEYLYSTVDQSDPAAVTSFAQSTDGASGGIYLAHRMRICPDLATEIGARWDRQDYTDDNQVSPRFNLLWHASERSELRFAVGRFQQSQRIHELHIEDGQTSFLPAEVSEQVELTFQHRFDTGLRLRVDAYWRKLSSLRPRYENLFAPIELFPETAEDRVEVAPEAARLRGIELMLSGKNDRPLVWWVSYVRSLAEDSLDGRDVPRSWDQPHAGKFLVGYSWSGRWFLSLNGTAHTGWPTTPATGAVVPDPAVVRNTARFPSYARLDLEVQRAFETRHGRLSLKLEAINLTDRDNACCVDEFELDTQPDGSVAVNTVYDYWLGFTPAFSVVWAF